VGERTCQALAEALDSRRAGRVGQAIGDLAKFVPSALELVEPDRQVADAVAAAALVEGAVLERGEVAVDGGLGSGDLGRDRPVFGLVSVAAFGAERPLGGDGCVAEVGAAVEVDQRLFVVEQIGVDALGGAAGPA
jgi:hypothetical protein